MLRSLALLSFCLAALTGWAQQFRYVPERPKPGDVLSFTYVPGAVLAKETVIQGTYVRYGSPLAMRLSQPATATAIQEGNAVMGDLILPSTNVSGLVMAFRSKANKLVTDHNNGHFYPVLLYDTTGKLLPHAVGGQASVLTRTAFPYELNITPDWAWAVQQYEKEINRFPANRALYWADLISAQIRQNKPGAKATALTNIDAYLKSRTPNPTPTDLNEAARLYEQLSQPALATAARDRIKTVDPTGDAAQKARAETVRSETDLGKKMTAYSSFTTAFPASPYRAMLVSSVAETYFKAGQFRELNGFLAQQTVPNTDPALLHSFAQQMTDEGRGISQTDWLAGRAIAALMYHNPAKNSVDDRTRQLRIYRATLAYAFAQQKRFAPALATFRQAIDGLDPDATDPRTNERTWLCAVQATKADSVLPYIESVVRVGKGTPRLRASLRDWQTKRLGSVAKADTYLAGLEVNYRAIRRDELAESFVNEPAPNFTLTTLDGGTVSLASLRGKVVVVDFWATWCGPCIASFPAMRKARDHFKNDSRVQFLFVNTREGGPVSRVRSFIEKQPYTGVVPLDVTKRMSELYGVQGLPTKVIIDPKGRVRYRSLGYNNNPDATAEEITLVIEALNQ